MNSQSGLVHSQARFFNVLLNTLDSCFPIIVRKDPSICESTRHLPKMVARSSSITIFDPGFCKDRARLRTVLDVARPKRTKRVSSTAKENWGMFLKARTLINLSSVRLYQLSRVLNCSSEATVRVKTSKATLSAHKPTGTQEFCKAVEIVAKHKAITPHC